MDAFYYKQLAEEQARLEAKDAEIAKLTERLNDMDTRFAIAFEALQDIADWGEYRSGGIADAAIEKLRGEQ